MITRRAKLAALGTEEYQQLRDDLRDLKEGQHQMFGLGGLLGGGYLTRNAFTSGDLADYAPLKGAPRVSHLKAFVNSVRHNPKRFAKGNAKLLAGLGLLGAGVNRLAHAGEDD